MRIEPIEFQGWPEAYRCTVPGVELVVVTSVGPRILSLGVPGGPNLLYIDDTGFGVGAWRMYGGHRFSTAPESGFSYVPDDQPCRTVVDVDRVAVTQERMPNGLRKILTIEPAVKEAGFTLVHTLLNEGDIPWSGAIWAITCVPAMGTVSIPQHPNGESSTPRCHFWSSPGFYDANPNSPQWRSLPDRFSVHPIGETAKVGLHAIEGRIDFEHPAAGLTLLQSEVPEPAECPHHGCNLEVFTAEKYVELEMLGGIRELAPGESMELTQRWLVRAKDGIPGAREARRGAVTMGNPNPVE